MKAKIKKEFINNDLIMFFALFNLVKNQQISKAKFIKMKMKFDLCMYFWQKPFWGINNPEEKWPDLNGKINSEFSLPELNSPSFVIENPEDYLEENIPLRGKNVQFCYS